MGDRRGIAEAECRLAGVLSDEGRFNEAERYCQTSMKAFESFDDRSSVAHCQGQMGIISMQRHRWKEAARHLIEASVVFHEQHPGDGQNGVPRVVARYFWPPEVG